VPSVQPTAVQELRVLAELLREQRLRKGLSQENAGLAGGLARKTFGKIERGDASPLFESVVDSIRGIGDEPADFFRAYADRLDAARAGGS
jgi:DNA-binding XRE family transcriptional regulator